ncbi:MAG: hypothetical protein Q8K70_01780 [Bacteroidota bacterium]|nr:hypothetical protein [Bacteroidota bacterium]
MEVTKFMTLKELADRYNLSPVAMKKQILLIDGIAYKGKRKRFYTPGEVKLIIKGME